MTIPEAQREMRSVFFGGSVGQLVSSAIWLASAALATAGAHTQAMLALAVGGMFIFPLTTLALRLLGSRASVRRENPLTFLALQVALTIPLAIPLILAAAAHKPEWFYAGFLIVVGAHYLPFVTLYGLPIFAVAGGLMVGAGIVLPSLRPGEFALGGWIGGVLLALFGVVLLVMHRSSVPHSP